jgi:DNA invertase Pin-like site-specific DNA recombinase
MRRWVCGTVLVAKKSARYARAPSAPHWPRGQRTEIIIFVHLPCPLFVNGLAFTYVMHTMSCRMGQVFGYARVSTVGQPLEVQLEQLKAAGCAVIFREKVSGATSERRELARLLKRLEKGDELIVTRIDRLARSTFDLFSIVKRVVEAGARFRSLAQPWADTSDSTGRLMLAVLGGLADVERDLIKVRTAEGRQRAQARGVKMGRKPKLTLDQRQEALGRKASGETNVDIARSYNVSHMTIARLSSK